MKTATRMTCAAALLSGAILGTWTGFATAAEPAAVSIKVGKTEVDFLAGNDLVARYHFGPEVAKPYFWPINGPNGLPITRAWPMVKGLPGESTDHIHQKSAWFCHGDIIPEGVELVGKIKGVEGSDFWSENPNHGKMVCTLVGEPKVEKHIGRISTLNEWRTAENVKILDEARHITLHNFGDTRLLVFDIDLTAAVPVTFGDTKEGSFGIRIADAITEKSGKGKLENANGGVGEKACWGYKSDWCDYSGPIGDQVVGLAVLDDPTNAYRACWHARGYGLMAANPFGRNGAGFPAMKGQIELVKLEKGKHLKLRYGILIHPGDARTGKVADYYQQFVKLR